MPRPDSMYPVTTAKRLDDLGLMVQEAGSRRRFYLWQRKKKLMVMVPIRQAAGRPFKLKAPSELAVAAGIATVFEPGKNEWTADGLTKLVNVFEAGPQEKSPPPALTPSAP